jgi:DNA topoisomerase-1
MTDIMTPSKEQDVIESARSAGLRYVSDQKPGIRRERIDDTIVYIDPKGNRIDDPGKIERINKLAIPPAWTDVWICTDPRGHIQATGRDPKGRKQYRYHQRWREVRDETKYERMIAFGKALPAIRERIEHDLRLPGLPRPKVLATVVRLLEVSLIRVGNTEYARDNKSYGLTTMRDKHVTVSGSTIEFKFKGKSGKYHNIDIKDRQLAKIVKQCRDIPGYELFQYIDEAGERQDVDSSAVNAYLQEITGEAFTAKDFRTWAGTVLASLALRELEPAESDTQAKKNIVRTIEHVAERLGNTPAICRKCYVHPTVLNAYLDGTLLETLTQRAEDELESNAHALGADERMVLDFLHQELEKQQSN